MAGRTAAAVQARPPGRFRDALLASRARGRLAVIAEVKRVSPALGALDTAVDPVAQARAYAAAGASAISVLTEPRHWGGRTEDVVAIRAALPDVPILWKDVVISEAQVADAAGAGADAVLLIAEALDDVELRALMDAARRLGLEPFVEAHEPDAFARAIASGALVVGANARDLRVPAEIDRSRAATLAPLVSAGQLFVAESEIESADDARRLPARADAILVGTALMRAADPGPLLRELSSIKRGVEVA